MMLQRQINRYTSLAILAERQLEALLQ